MREKLENVIISFSHLHTRFFLGRVAGQWP